MTKLVVPIMVQSLEQALDDAERAAARGADLVEFRIDSFTDDPGELPKLAAGSALPCIITCRPTWEGGAYDGDEAMRISLLEASALGERPPAYLDVELAAYLASANIKQKVELVVQHPGQPRETPTRLILSSHDFKEMPWDLPDRVKRMQDSSACAAVKIAWHARSAGENVDAFKLIQAATKPTVALCMGEKGLASRVLAKKFGALLTFASLDARSGTAPGQPTVEQLKHLYRWDAVGPATRVYGVIGHPIAHSMSPAIHNAGFDELGYDGVYVPIPVEPGYEAFNETVGAWLDMDGLDFCGASVTLPHKTNLMRFVRERGGEIEPLAEMIGAANTLCRREDGSLYASNTDYAGALDALCDGAGFGREALRGKRVAVIGAGGAARAIAAGLTHHGATVVVYNRTLEKAQALAEELAVGGAAGKVVAAPLGNLCKSCCEVYINCTPIGMWPDLDQTPVPAESQREVWGEGVVVFDTIYNPPVTRLLREAKEAGCTVVSGTEMFVRQAALQFELWTGKPAPARVFEDVLMNSLLGSV